MIEPLTTRVLVKPVKNEQKTNSGIYLPGDNSKIKQGIVEAVGDDPMIKVKKGDKVIFEGFQGIEVDYDGEKYLILQFQDILAKVD